MDDQNGQRLPYRRMLALMRYRGLAGGEAMDGLASQQQHFEDAIGQVLENTDQADDVRIHRLGERGGVVQRVEQPADEAFAPLYASLTRTGILLLVGLIIAGFASLLFARRMVTPIRALQEGAARIGAGDLDQRIELCEGRHDRGR